ncbi:MAG: phospho-sugar mutase [Oscillospiraceae bacterium]|jgi:phosphoglucomutase|nr:phospho-sugar mutase [Oscillospiraceae bacterium]
MTTRELYTHWIASYPEYRGELEAISDESEREDRFYRSLEFGTGGMRGVLGAGENRMNAVIIRRVTRALAETILEQPDGASRHVVIGFDSRRNSDLFAREAACTLAACGVKSQLFDTLRPVPMLSFAVRYTEAIAGIEITASHNPPQYNGYKVYWSDGAQLPPDHADVIQRRMRDDPAFRPMPEDEARAKGLITSVPVEADDAYIEMVKGLSVQPDLLREHGAELEIAYTPLHGAGCVPVRRVLNEVGITNLKIVKEQEQPDGAFPTVRVPNPEERETMRMVVELASRIGADVAFATDPDSDRLGVAARESDGSYRLINGNQIGCLLLYYILSQREARGTLPKDGVLVTTIVSTEMAEAIASSFGVATRDVLTGFKFIAEQIQDIEENGGTFLFGYEESYGYLSSTSVRDKDAVNASLLVAELALWLKRSGKTLLGLLEEMYAKYGYYADAAKSVQLPGKNGLTKMRAIMADLRANPPTEFAGIRAIAARDYLNRVRVDLTDSNSPKSAPYEALPKSDVLYYELEGGDWICIRPSGTEPKIKLYANIRRDSMEKADAAAAAALAALEARLTNV